MFLLVGLGNPELRYEGTRHNVGFMLVDRLASLASGRFQSKFEQSEVCLVERGNRSMVLAKPQTYMNRSGVAVRSLVAHYDVEMEDLLVVYDEVQLPLGKLRLRCFGSSGGQKGMESVIRMLGTDQIPRLRIGVGTAQQPDDLADYVLSPFSRQEQRVMDSALDRGVLAVDMILTQGYSRAMELFNGPEKKDPLSLT